MNKLNNFKEITEWLASGNLAIDGELIYKLTDNILYYYSENVWHKSTGVDFNSPNWAKFIPKKWYEKEIPKGGVLIKLPNYDEYFIATKICYYNTTQYQITGVDGKHVVVDNNDEIELVSHEELMKLSHNQHHLLQDIL
jgi:hypothetical protein